MCDELPFHFHDTVPVTLDVVGELTGSIGNRQLEFDPADEFMTVGSRRISSPQPTSQEVVDDVLNVVDQDPRLYGPFIDLHAELIRRHISHLAEGMMYPGQLQLQKNHFLPCLLPQLAGEEQLLYLCEQAVVKLNVQLHDTFIVASDDLGEYTGSLNRQLESDPADKLMAVGGRPIGHAVMQVQCCVFD